MQLSSRTKITSLAGFSLIELSIVLLIAGLLIAGAFSLTNNMQKQRGDQAQANQMRTVVTALERYVTDNQGALTSGAAAPLNCPGLPCSVSKSMVLSGSATGTTIGILHPPYTSEMVYFQNNYLPGGTGTTVNPNPFSLANYSIGLTNFGAISTSGNTNGGQNIRGLVLYKPGNTIDDGRLARISTLIGSEGGMISNTAATPFAVNGAFGAWQVANPIAYTLNGVAAAGEIAAYTATVDSQINTNLLSRINTGNIEANTMENDLIMGKDSAYPVQNITNPATPIPDSSPAMFQSTLGVGFLTTTAIPAISPSGSCEDTSGTFTITSTINGTPTTYSYDPSKPSKNGQRLQNAVVMGVGTDGITPTLLQCREVGGHWYWQAAIPSTNYPPSKWYFYYYGAYPGFPYPPSSGTVCQVPYTFGRNPNGACQAPYFVNTTQQLWTVIFKSANCAVGTNDIDYVSNATPGAEYSPTIPNMYTISGNQQLFTVAPGDGFVARFDHYDGGGQPDQCPGQPALEILSTAIPPVTYINTDYESW